MDSSPTLKDFVLNLIYDSAARSAFELDPETTLQHAGLGDVTAADVQQVIPLVVDYTPVTGVAGLSEMDDLTTGVANLDVAGAVAHLQTITAYAALAPGQGVGADLSAASVHTAAVGFSSGEFLTGGTAFDTALSGYGSLSGVGGLSPAGDPAHHLDGGLDGGFTIDTHSQVAVSGGGHPVPELDIQPLDNVGAVPNLPTSIDQIHTPGLDVGDISGATSSVGSLIDPDLSVDPVQSVHGVVSSVAGTGQGIIGTTAGIGHEAGLDLGHDLGGGIIDLHH